MAEEEDENDGKEDFILHEEEYDDNREHEIDLQNTTHPQQWWSAVNDSCNTVYDSEEYSDGSWNESDLDILCSDDEEGQEKKRVQHKVKIWRFQAQNRYGIPNHVSSEKYAERIFHSEW